jgi:murein DD-endopeptidase MepM/ murein hydrolase activator NlpD
LTVASFGATAQPQEPTDTTAPPDTQAPEAPAEQAPEAPEEGSAAEDEAPSPPTTAGSSEERARAVANLSLARAADEEIASALRSITAEANQTVERIREAEDRIERANAAAEQASRRFDRAQQEQAEIEDRLRLQAIEDYRNRAMGGSSDLLFQELSLGEAIRRNQFLDEANTTTAESLERLRSALEDERLAQSETRSAAREAERARAELEAQLENLKDQQTAQLELKTEAERRIGVWAGELTAYAEEDAAVQNLINQSAERVNTAINNPTPPSELGFQWPIEGARISSEYGYRIHPVYGTRRLHAGIDLAAPRGTPIASANTGVVIFAGVRGGYGRTVIVDHGNDISTLYAHMTEIGVVEGQNIDRGDIVGFVGATGTATGNHLHFEIRVGGGTVNPRTYLP